jgi:hypothetical protein
MTRDAAIKHRLAFNAFCDGAVIEMQNPECRTWSTTNDPCWLPDWEYRVRCNMTSIDAEDLIAECVDGCDPQTIAENIRAYCRERGQR